MKILAHIRLSFHLIFSAYVAIAVLKVKFNRQGQDRIAAHTLLRSQNITPELQVGFGRKFLMLNTGNRQKSRCRYQPNLYFWYCMQFPNRF